MALLRLSEEEVAKLLKERDAKLAELEQLRTMSETALWEADLKTFEQALEVGGHQSIDQLTCSLQKYEKKERDDELAALSKQAKAGGGKAKDEDKGARGKGAKGSRKSLPLKRDFLPSSDARAVSPIVDNKLLAKYKIGDMAREKKEKKGVTTPRGGGKAAAKVCVCSCDTFAEIRRIAIDRSEL